ncbi:MAG: ABC transporter substrate-binding protein, partial [Thermodesulfobacteriota bacterium]
AGCSGKKTPESTVEKVVKIGALAPLTGPAAHVGEEFKGGVAMAMEECGYKVGPYRIELKWLDTESDAEKACRAMEEAIVKDNIVCSFLSWHSWEAVALMDLVAKYKMPHFFGFGATKVVNEKYTSDPEKYAYWVGKFWPSPSKLTTAYIEALNGAIQQGLWSPRNRRVALYGVDNDWGRDFAEAIGNQFQAAGWQVVTKEWVALGETEFYPLLKKLKDLDVSVVAGTMSDPPSVSAFIKQARQVGLKSFIVCDGLGWIGDWYKLTGDASDYVLDQIPQWTTDKARKFKEDFQKKFGFEPGPSTAGLAYDQTQFLLEILNEAVKQHGEITRETLAKVAKEMVMTGKLTLTEGIMMKEYKFTPESFPDPAIGQDYYIFPVIQYFKGEGRIVWPAAWKQADLQVPDYLK